jgi:hypothetical protein
VKTLTDFHYVWPSERNSKRKKIFTGAVQNWLKTQTKKKKSDGIKELLKRWKRCVEVEGDYVEK